MLPNIALPAVLPARLDDLLTRIARPVVYRIPVYGASAACERDDHDFRTWIEGTYGGRDIRLRKCSGCEGVEVRDVSWGGSIGRARLAQRRIDALLGWYTGQRQRGRQFYG